MIEYPLSDGFFDEKALGVFVTQTMVRILPILRPYCPTWVSIADSKNIAYQGLMMRRGCIVLKHCLGNEARQWSRNQRDSDTHRETRRER